MLNVVKFVHGFEPKTATFQTNDGKHFVSSVNCLVHGNNFFFQKKTSFTKCARLIVIHKKMAEDSCRSLVAQRRH